MLDPYVLTLLSMIVALLALLIAARQRRRSDVGACPGRSEIAVGELVLRLKFTDGGAAAPGENGATPEVAPRRKTEPDEKKKPAADRRIIIDVLMLRALYDYVTQYDNGDVGRTGFKEVFAYCSGPRVDATTFVVSHILSVDFAEQSASGVKVADDSNIATLAALDEAGLPLVCHAHSHPTFGPGGTTPSAIDRSFQTRLESGGHRALGLIFSRDGFVRFFAGEQAEFVVDVQGNGAERIEENVFRLHVANRPVPVRVSAK